MSYKTANEQTRLLSEAQRRPPQNDGSDDVISPTKLTRPTRTPLPVKQLVILCVMRLTEPVSYTLIFPFITQMLQEMKVSEDPRKVGYYAGLIESLFSVAQLCTAIFWGRLSDRIGRKPVMLTGLLGMAIGVLLFGVQKTYLGLVVSRCISGMMNGNIAILPSIVGEITDSTNFAIAATYLPISYAIGSIMGPAIGGVLAVPAEQYPDLFGNNQFLIEFPYFLPCLVGGLLNFAAILLGVFFMEETLESKRKLQPAATDDYNKNNCYGTVSSLEHSHPAASSSNSNLAAVSRNPPSIWSLCTPPVMMLFLTVGIMHLQNVAWNAVLPIYGYTAVDLGGLGLSLKQIGLVLGTTGFGSILIQLWVFPPLQERFGAAKLFRLANHSFTITFLCLPFLSYLARLPSSTNELSVFYMALVMIMRSPGVICYVCSLMLTNMAAPSSSALGTINGLNQTCRAFAQAIGPVLGTSLYALSISTGILGGNLVWVIMALISLLAQLCSQKIKETSSSSK